MMLEINKEIALASFRLIESGDPRLARKIIADDFINREADDDDQPDRAAPGVEGFLATSSWLRAAFSDLHFEMLEVARKEIASSSSRK